MTQATISLLKSNGMIESIDCDNGGALYQMGWLLYTEYQDAEKIKKLISLGSLIKLKKDIDIPPSVEHSDYYEQKDICVFKDRDAMKIAPSKHYTMTQYIEKMSQYIHKDYLFDEKENQWKFLSPTSLTLHPLNVSMLTSYELTPSQRQKIEQDIYEEQVTAQRDKIASELPIKPVHTKSKKI
jgi:hypothetical protein